MFRRKPLCAVLVSLLTAVLLLLHAGCKKELSYEQRASGAVDVVPPPAPAAKASCSLCNAAGLPDSSWRFTIDSTIYYGRVEKTVVLLGRRSFTFFGPSACSADSGFVATIYLNDDTLNRDKTNLLARMTCYYYDKVTPSYMFMSGMGEFLPFVIS